MSTLLRVPETAGERPLWLAGHIGFEPGNVGIKIQLVRMGCQRSVRRFGRFLKRLAVISECLAMVTAYQRHTRPSPTSACGPALSLVWRDLRPPCIWDGLGEGRYGEVSAGHH